MPSRPTTDPSHGRDLGRADLIASSAPTGVLEAAFDAGRTVDDVVVLLAHPRDQRFIFSVDLVLLAGLRRRTSDSLCLSGTSASSSVTVSSRTSSR